MSEGIKIYDTEWNEHHPRFFNVLINVARNRVAMNNLSMATKSELFWEWVLDEPLIQFTCVDCRGVCLVNDTGVYLKNQIVLQQILFKICCICVANPIEDYCLTCIRRIEDK